MAITVEMRTEISQLYVALFGRAPDSEGLGFWVTLRDSGQSLTQIANTMYATTPARAYYPLFLTNEEIIASFYVNVLGRTADAEGLAFWTAKLNATGATPGSVITEMIDVVANYAGTDPAGLVSQALFNNKVEVAQYYGEHAGNIEGATSILVGVTADDATVTAAIAAIDGGSATIGQSFTLTTTVDTITISTANEINQINGVVDGTTTTNSTFSIGDTVTGNGKTILQLAVADSGTAPFTSVKNVAAVNLLAGATGTLDITAVNWSGIGAVNLTSGVDGLRVNIDQLNAGADLSIGTGVSGAMSVDFTNDINAWLSSDRGSSIAFVDGNVTGVADAGGSATFEMSATANSTAITVGDVSITAVGGANGDFSVSNDYAKGGDITVGNITITGFDNIDLDVSNTAHTASSTAVNTTVGNVTLGVNAAGWFSADFSLSSSGAAGNLTVGDLTVNMAKNAQGSVDVDLDGTGTSGNLSLGNVAVVLAGGNTGTFDLSVTNSVYASGTKAATAGTTTVGSIGLNIGLSADAYVWISADAYSAGTGKATVGNVAVGTVNAILGQNASGTVSVEASANSTGGAASVGDVSIGSASYTLAVDAYGYQDLYVQADAGGTAAGTVGNVTSGGLTVSAGINTTFSASHDVFAYGSTSSAIGNVTMGDLVMVGDDGAYVSYTMYADSHGKIGNVALGNTSVTLGVSATGWVGNYFSADKSIGTYTVGNVSATSGVNARYWSTYSADAAGGSIGAVTVGDVSMTASNGAYWAGVSMEFRAKTDIGNVVLGNTVITAGKDAGAYVSNSFDAIDGSIGTMTIGDISVSSGAATGAHTWDGAWYYLFANAEKAIGNVTVGNVDISSIGATASAYASMTWENDLGGTIGDVTIGNVTATVNGANAYGGYYVSVSAADTGGTLTLGNLNLTTGNAAAKTGANLEIDAYNYLGAVVVGDITLTASGVRDGTTTDLRTYDADVYLWAETTVTVGNITVTGGDGAAEDFGTLTNWLTLTGNTGTETIGGVDYSGYGAAATLDVSIYAGAAFVIGGAKADTITDNKGANALTGNGGADTFVFLDTNTGMTEATADSITDFNNAAGDKINLAPVLVVAEYGEASYGTFAEFLTGAAAGNKDVFVGQIGSDSFVAVDYNSDNAVDFLVKLTGVSLAQIDLASFV